MKILLLLIEPWSSFKVTVSPAYREFGFNELLLKMSEIILSKKFLFKEHLLTMTKHGHFFYLLQAGPSKIYPHVTRRQDYKREPVRFLLISSDAMLTLVCVRLAPPSSWRSSAAPPFQRLSGTPPSSSSGPVNVVVELEF